MKLIYILAATLSVLSFTSAAPMDKRAISSCYKNAYITQYWIPKEGDKDMTNNGKIVSLTGSKTKSLKTSKGKEIAKVAPNTFDKFQMEGTGLLQNGKMVNLDDGVSSFMEVNRKSSPFGHGGFNDNNLVPWVSIAANDIKAGTKLYIKQLDGVKLSNGMTHNGCVRVDDRGWSFSGCQIDFFVLQYTSYTSLTKLLPSKVSVVEKSCTIKNYVNSAVKDWAVL
ncbi:hypothetical protein F4703DRAFT_1857817 [Phycomyces blakesleeanus]|uniref:3D domain-containing protein n=2 Tax=Phycomyces blakesleeanus TaxID=4837 RepID=A0A167LPQ3_PHYB8|nr:hypothetical protein PHYBLDRAFT_64064 [Phycomyces blakesleeanus NRRL 1555(-)]OAD70864.1 hypothetical protein PHYBLDRAFT_64064 [Phycomyces blakesleeanus NRRL 1555(-)]|eukprot:XP_018288904.1 hypothetical protein PHYBLDRAFT_64064 [Phycomyces blakesleeanus NRRL 1555(-)]